MKVFPQYMAMGMTYDEFWHGPSFLAQAYRQAYEERRHQEEWARWRHGAYIYNAILLAAPVLKPFVKGKVEPGKYPSEPWPLTKKEAEEREQRIELENTRQFIKRLEAESERALKQREEASNDG